MKRSEVISKLINFHEDVFPSVGRGLSQKDYFTELLDMLEGEGMLPPNYEGLMSTGEKFVREKHVGRDTMMILNRWEPEDG